MRSDKAADGDIGGLVAAIDVQDGAAFVEGFFGSIAPIAPLYAD